MSLMNILARNVTRRGTHPFISHADGTITYRVFERLSSQAANALIALGAGPGSCVTVALENSIEHLVAAFGVLKAGAVSHPVDPTTEPSTLAHILSCSNPALIVTSADHADALRSVSGSLGLRATIVELNDVGDAAAATAPPCSPNAPGAGSAAAAAFAAGAPSTGTDASLDSLLMSSPTTRPRPAVSPDAPALLLYTAGSTGLPRGVFFARDAVGSTGLHLVEALGITSDDTLLSVAPLSTGFGWTAVEAALHAAATLAYPTTFEPSRFWTLAYRTGATVLLANRRDLARVLLRRPSPREHDSMLRLVVGPGTGGVRDEILERWSVSRVADCFWSTETGVVTVTPESPDLHPGCCGLPLPGVGVRIVDDAARELGTGQVGEIAVRSPHALAATLAGEVPEAVPPQVSWVPTGDLGWLDRDGLLHFVDRKADVVRRGEDLVSSVQVEMTIATHPRVSEVAVVGVEDASVGQELKAIVVPNGSVTEQELCEFAAQRLHESHVPRLWEFRPGLPRTHSRSIDKHTLREEARGGRASGVD